VRDLVDLAGEHRGGPGARVHLLLDLQMARTWRRRMRLMRTTRSSLGEEAAREDLHEADLRADSRVTQLISASGRRR
jgi:hypothetical protein